MEGVGFNYLSILLMIEGGVCQFSFGIRAKDSFEILDFEVVLFIF